MNQIRLRNLLKKALLLIALPVALVAGNAKAAATYYFWTESAYTYTFPEGSLEQTWLTGSDLNLARSTFADSIQVTLLGTEGHLRYDYVAAYRLQLDQFNLILGGDPSAWGLESLNPLVCAMVFCDISANLEVDGRGLSGGISIGHYDIQISNLELSGTGTSWSGWWGWDPNYPFEGHPTYFVTGSWRDVRDVPLPGTLALLGLGLTALAALRRRH